MRLSTTPRLDNKTPQALVRLLSDMARQINGISEGTLYAFHNAATAAPTTGSYSRGDRILKSDPSEAGAAG